MMHVPAPRYEWGQRVQALTNLFNDGTYPEQPADILLVSEGEEGEVVQVGRHVESGLPVYMVEFSSRRVIGCTEPELMPRQLKEESL